MNNLNSRRYQLLIDSKKHDILFNYSAAAMDWDKCHQVHYQHTAMNVLLLMNMEKKLKLQQVLQKIHPDEYAGVVWELKIDRRLFVQNQSIFHNHISALKI